MRGAQTGNQKSDIGNLFPPHLRRINYFYLTQETLT